MDDLKRNGSGHVDPTAYKAFQTLKTDRDGAAKAVAHVIYKVARLAGFMVLQLTIIDNSTGEIYKK